jgi:signal transduction histidine kinase
VLIASNGKTACDILQQADAPTLAIVDWLMPEMDGIDVCRRIRQSIKDRYVYLIMLTSRSETGFLNLLSNAIKFSPAGAPVEVRLDCDPAQVRLSVTDLGEGIPEDFRTRIFQKFAQVDSTDSRKKGGTGLGLSIFKGIVKEHKGRIDYRSQAGFGTEFYIELPVAAPGYGGPLIA